MTIPAGLATGGASLWKAITSEHDLDAAQLAQLVEACRAKDRLDKMDESLRVAVDVTLLSAANATANLMKQLLAAMRLPDDATGKRPQFRGARGAQKPSVPSGVSSIRERLRESS